MGDLIDSIVLNEFSDKLQQKKLKHPCTLNIVDNLTLTNLTKR